MRSPLAVTSCFVLILSSCLSLQALKAADEKQGIDSAKVPRYLEVTAKLVEPPHVCKAY